MYNLIMKEKILRFIKKEKMFLILILLGIVYLIFQAYLFRGVSWENYIYIHQDFWRRIEDSQFYLGLRSSGQFHAPLPSLIFTILLSLGINQLYFVNFIIHFCFAILLYFICREFTKDKNISFIPSFFYLTNALIIQQVNYLGLYDLMASFFIGLGVFLFIKNESKKTMFLSGITFGLAGLTQYSGIFAVPFLLLFILLKRNLSLREKLIRILTFSIPCGIIAGSFFLYRLIKFGNAFYSHVEQFEYFKFNFSNIGFYIFAFLAVFGIPAILISVFGIRNLFKVRKALKFVFLILPTVLFFVFFYIWSDWRFMTYLIPAFYLIFAFGLVEVKKHLSNLKLITVFAVFLAFGIFYGNLSLNGYFGIPIWFNKVIQNDIQYIHNLPTSNLKVIDTKNIQPYFYLDNNWDSRILTNSEIGYYYGTINYQNVLDIQKIIQNKTFALVLNNERFARYHQFSTAFRKNVIMDPTDVQIRDSEFLITDHELDDLRFFKFVEVQKIGNLLIYQSNLR